MGIIVVIRIVLYPEFVCSRRALLVGYMLHAKVIWLRRSGFCPCCQQVPVCNEQGKLSGAEFDHFYARHRNAAHETWLICSECNRRLETTDFKTGARSAFESYQQALRPFLEDGQSTFQ